jgi:hypothetical protein
VSKGKNPLYFFKSSTHQKNFVLVQKSFVFGARFDSQVFFGPVFRLFASFSFDPKLLAVADSLPQP